VLLSLDIADGYIAASLEYGSLIMVNRYDTGLRSWMWGYSYDVDYNDVVARDGYAYIGNCDTWHMESGLEVVDISDPTQPTRVGFLYQSGCILEVALGLTHVYYHDWYKIAVVDVSDPYHPTAVGQLAMTDASGIYVQEPYLYVACGGYGLKVVDVSNPSAPVVVGSSYFPGFGALDVWVSAGYAYVCGYNASTGIGLWIFNVTNPMAPALVATFATNDYAERIWGRDTYLYIACDEFFRILDVADPTNPLEVGNIAFNRLQGRIGIAPPYIYAIQGVIGAASGALLKLQTSLITAVHEERRFADTLEQNYPNPFNPATTIRYSISKQGHVSLRIYNAAGQLVRTLVDQEQTPRGGGYVATWDSTDNNGIHVASGVYFCRMTANEFSETKKMVVIK
jgi:hypothetical protein